MTPDELIDFTPALHQKALDLIKDYRIGPDLYAPGLEQGRRPVGNAGAGPGDRRHQLAGRLVQSGEHTVYVYACNACLGTDGMVAPPQDFTDLPYVEGQVGQPVTMIFAAGANQGPMRSPRSRRRLRRSPPRNTFRDLSVEGLPLIKPPYSTISAINLDTGQIEWQVAHGDTPDYIRRSPALKGWMYRSAPASAASPLAH